MLRTEMAIEKSREIRYTFIIIRLLTLFVKSVCVKEKNFMKSKYNFLTSREVTPTG